MKTIGILFFFFMGIFCFACERKKGCLDENAANFDSRARKSAPCIYEGQVVLWADSAGLGRHAGKAVDVYFDNEKVFSQEVLQPTTGAGSDCSGLSGLRAARAMGEHESRLLNYMVISGGAVLADSTIELQGGYCVPHRLVLR